jgi:hypothetical protein
MRIVKRDFLGIGAGIAYDEKELPPSACCAGADGAEPLPVCRVEVVGLDLATQAVGNEPGQENAGVAQTVRDDR